jgi:hypothetical protein
LSKRESRKALSKKHESDIGRKKSKQTLFKKLKDPFFTLSRRVKL